MSECVVRMEMPINCFECPMYDWNRQKLCCNAHLDLRPIPNGGVPKPDWCPIICQLPEGHGRLIDADAMAEDVRSLWDYETVDGITASTVLKQTLTDIGNCPTIVPAEAERSET